MTLRQEEYANLGLNVRWLDHVRANNAYEYALRFSSSKRYGLNEDTVSGIERHVIASRSIADQWLQRRLTGTGTLQIVYSESEVCVLDTDEFLRNWQNIFVPARDDAIILHNLNDTVVFYCHEEELEYGHRNA